SKSQRQAGYGQPPHAFHRHRLSIHRIPPPPESIPAIQQVGDFSVSADFHGAYAPHRFYAEIEPFEARSLLAPGAGRIVNAGSRGFGSAQVVWRIRRTRCDTVAKAHMEARRDQNLSGHVEPVGNAMGSGRPISGFGPLTVVEEGIGRGVGEAPAPGTAEEGFEAPSPRAAGVQKDFAIRRAVPDHPGARQTGA